MFEWYKRARNALARKLFRQEYKKFLKKEYNIKQAEEKPRPDNKEFYAWITSKEGRRETDLEFILLLSEQILERVISGELGREDLQRMIQTTSPFREKRFSRLVDDELEGLIKETRSKMAGPPQEAVEVKVEEVNTNLIQRSLAFVRDVFPEAGSLIKVTDTVKKIPPKQWLTEKQRHERLMKALLANSPEFLEQLLVEDRFESEKQQKEKEEKVLAKEKKKLRARLVPDQVPFKQPRERTPKELAEEKLRIIRKLREDLGKGVSTST